MVTNPNYKPGVGRLATDRYDFQSHVDGGAFYHKASSIKLDTPLTINLNVTNDVQAALGQLKIQVDAVGTPADATTISKGIIQLSGDIGGTATSVKVTGLRGFPVANLTPTNGQVLQFNDGTGNWEPSDSITSFTASNDLIGDSVSQSVISLTGATLYPGFTGTEVKSDSLVWKSDIPEPMINQKSSLSVGHGKRFLINAQNAQGDIGNPFNGGTLLLSGGARVGGAGASFDGGVALSLGGYDWKLIQAMHLNTDSRVVSLCKRFGITETQMPSGTGSNVIYIGNADTVPTSGNPVGGAILYSDAGVLNVKQSDGTTFPIEPGGDVDDIYLKKGTGVFDTLSSYVEVDSTGHLFFTSGSNLSNDPASEVNMYISGSSLMRFTGGGTMIINGGFLQALTTGAISLDTASALQSNADGSIRLRNTTTDWVGFGSARSMADCFNFPISGSFGTGDGWTNNTSYTLATIAGSVVAIEIPVPRECQGATFSSLSMVYINNTGHTPATPASIYIARVEFGTNVDELLHASPNNLVYGPSSSITTFTVNFTTNNTIDKSTYRYFVRITEESGAGSVIGSTRITGFKANYTNITQHRF